MTGRITSDNDRINGKNLTVGGIALPCLKCYNFVKGLYRTFNKLFNEYDVARNHIYIFTAGGMT